MAAPGPVPDPLGGMRSRDSDRAAVTRAVKDLVRKQLDLDADAPVFVAEITCGEIECPDRETVVAIYHAGGRREFRILKDIGSVTGADIAAAIAARSIEGGSS